jgi:hypothetical protein
VSRFLKQNGLRLPILSTVSDPYSFDTDPDPLNTDPDPDPIRIQGFDEKKKKNLLTAEKKICGSKTTIDLSLGLHNGRSSYRISLQLSKENIQHSKT